MSAFSPPSSAARNQVASSAEGLPARRRAYICTQRGCRRVFTRSHNLKSHMRTHSGERPYSCSVCERTFTRKHDRDSHATTHVGGPRFLCACNKSFSRKSDLGRHTRNSSCPSHRPSPGLQLRSTSSNLPDVDNFHIPADLQPRPAPCTPLSPSSNRPATPIDIHGHPTRPIGPSLLQPHSGLENLAAPHPGLDGQLSPGTTRTGDQQAGGFDDILEFHLPTLEAGGHLPSPSPATIPQSTSGEQPPRPARAQTISFKTSKSQLKPDYAIMVQAYRSVAHDRKIWVKFNSLPHRSWINIGKYEYCKEYVLW